MSVSIAQIIQRFKNKSFYVRNGYYLNHVATISECNVKEGVANIFTGSVYQSGNESKSYINLSNLGTFHGNLVLIDSPEPDLELVVYNYLTSLIPGQFPSIGGPFSEEQYLYSLSDILEKAETDNVFVCKILGLGIGDIKTYQVANASRNAVSNLSENFRDTFLVVEDIRAGIFTSTISLKSPLIRQTNYSNVYPDYVYPLTDIGVNTYMADFDWESRYGISQINGTNQFPTQGWGGVRIGSIDPKTFQFLRDSLFNYPSSLLELQPNSPLGIIYAGQGVQISSYPSIKFKSFDEFNDRNKNIRVYQDRLNESSFRINGIQPYQQGRGIYEYLSREPEYSDSGLIRFLNIITTFGPEGCQPGRNNAFLGVAITDYYSFNLNLNNQEQASTSPRDTRRFIPDQVQTKQAHNAPLVYQSTDNNNTYNPLPWNSLNGYIGTTTSSSSNERSENTPILTSGVTTMVISGAYPLYRGSGFTEYSGLPSDQIFSIRYFSRYLSQYYSTPEFWNPEFSEFTSAEVNETTAIAPTPPYRIKGGRIVLYEGQRVIAGSYVYATVGMTGNVNMSQFYSGSAKEILLEKGFNRTLLGDLYSKYQSNQGGLIVTVVTDGHPVPNPPPNAQPIGIVLEDVIGIGTPTIINNQVQYDKQYDITSDLQTVPDYENTYQLQNRELLIQLFPMFPNLSTTSFPMTYLYELNWGTTVATDYLLQNPSYYEPEPITTPAAPLYQKIKTSYTLPDCTESYILDVFSSNLPIKTYGIRDKQLINDWPGPQSSILQQF